MPSQRRARDQALETLAAVARKFRPHYHRSLVEWYRPATSAAGLVNLGHLFHRLHGSLGNQPLAELFRLAEAYVDGLQQGRVSADASARTLLGQLDRVLKPLAMTPPTRPDPAVQELIAALLAELPQAGRQSVPAAEGPPCVSLPGSLGGERRHREAPSVMPVPDTSLLLTLPGDEGDEGGWADESAMMGAGMGLSTGWSSGELLDEYTDALFEARADPFVDLGPVLSADALPDLLSDPLPERQRASATTESPPGIGADDLAAELERALGAWNAALGPGDSAEHSGSAPGSGWGSPGEVADGPDQPVVMDEDSELAENVRARIFPEHAAGSALNPNADGGDLNPSPPVSGRMAP